MTTEERFDQIREARRQLDVIRGHLAETLHARARVAASVAQRAGPVIYRAQQREHALVLPECYPTGQNATNCSNTAQGHFGPRLNTQE
jgi:hypothetical protein